MLNVCFYYILLDISVYSSIHFPGEEDIIALQEHDIPFDNEESNLSEPLDRNFGSSTVGQKRIKCHVCEDADCSPPDICDDAITVKTLIFYVVFYIKFFFSYHNIFKINIINLFYFA